MAHSIKM